MERHLTITFFVNYNNGNEPNPLLERSICYYSSIEGIDISVKGKLVQVVNRNSYIIHDLPPEDVLEANNYEFVECRSGDNVVEGKANEGKAEEPDQEKAELDPPSQNGGDTLSRNGTVNNIILLKNNINKLRNI